MVGRVRVRHDGRRRAQEDGEVVGDAGVREVHHPVLGQQCGEDVAVLLRVRGRQGRQHARREAEVEADAVDVAAPDAGAGRDEQLVVDERLDQFLDDRQDGVPAPVHDRVAADLHDRLRRGPHRPRLVVTRDHHDPHAAELLLLDGVARLLREAPDELHRLAQDAVVGVVAGHERGRSRRYP